MPRQPNKNPPKPSGAFVTDKPFTLTLLPHERDFLQWNEPGPSGALGGYPRHENWLMRNIDPETVSLTLSPERLQRTIDYCANGGPGGPNGRIRAAMIPALRRAGIDINPQTRRIVYDPERWVAI